MKRWNELAVGYALGTLTPQEHQELLQLTVDNPQLMLDALRLRHMTSVQIAQKVDWPTEGFEVGAEGWADTATRSLRLALPEPIVSELDKAVSPAAAHALSNSASDGSNDGPNDIPNGRKNHQLSHPLVDSLVMPSEPNKASGVPFDRMRWSPASWHLFSRKGIWRWIIALGLITFGFDYWRVRRLLANTQGEILQPEMTTDQQPETIN